MEGGVVKVVQRRVSKRLNEPPYGRQDKFKQTEATCLEKLVP